MGHVCRLSLNFNSIFFWFVLIFTGYNLVPLPDDASFPSNREAITIVIDDKELLSECRGGGQEYSIPFYRRIITFFVPNSNSSGSLKQCPKPATQGMRFPYGPGSGNGGSGSGNDKGRRSQAVPDREEWDSDPDSYIYRYDKNQEKKKKGDEDQCVETPVTVYEDSLQSVRGVKSITKTAFNNKKVKEEYLRHKKRLEAGIHPMDINKKTTGRGKNIYLLKGGKGRYIIEYIETNDSRVVNILGIGDRSNNRNMNALEKAMLTNYGIVINY